MVPVRSVPGPRARHRPRGSGRPHAPNPRCPFGTRRRRGAVGDHGQGGKRILAGPAVPPRLPGAPAYRRPGRPWPGPRPCRCPDAPARRGDPRPVAGLPAVRARVGAGRGTETATRRRSLHLPDGHPQQPGDQPPPAAPPGPADSGTRVSLANVRPELRNDDIAVVQRALIALGYDLPGGADGYFGKLTRDVYAKEQRKQGFSGSDADGAPGCETLTKLGLKGGFTVDCGPDARPVTDTGSTAEQYAAEFNRRPMVVKEGHRPYQGSTNATWWRRRWLCSP
ncbi:peptidoglycan-binding protein [Streptomyces sp. DHE7-1]|nr:peptidoglycan-binding protein [Streptomyces sp. DHE7-1]